MAKLDIPPRLLGTFTSRVPTPETQRLLGPELADWGAAYLENAAEWAQFALARAWTQLPNIRVPKEAQALLEVIPLATDARATWKNATDVAARLETISVASLKVLETVMENIGAVVGAVPIIGAIARVGITIQTTFWSNWVASLQLPRGEPGFRYDYDSDQREQRDMIRQIESGDLTPIFLPTVELEELEVRMVQSKRRLDRRDWLVLPVGRRVGMGYLPGALGQQFGWEGRGPQLRSDYSPGALSTSTMAWDFCGGALADYVDLELVKLSWVEFFDRLEQLGRAQAWKLPTDSVTQKAISQQKLDPSPKRVIGDALRPIYRSDNVDEAIARGTPRYGLPPGNVLDEPPGGRTIAHVVAETVDVMRQQRPLLSAAVPAVGAPPKRAPVSRVFPGVVVDVGSDDNHAGAILAAGAGLGLGGWLLWRLLFR